MHTFDVIIIGAGPAGYVSAIRSAQLGLKVACIDSWINKDNKPTLGGTCLNVGCIPSKALLDSSEQYDHVAGRLASHGIRVSKATLDLSKMIKRKDDIVAGLTTGIESLFKKNKVTWVQGHARFVSTKRLEVTHHDGKTSHLEADHIVIATGSTPRHLPKVPIDGTLILDSSGALELQDVPKTLGIIGAGVIGIELGSVWKRLGSDVVLLEALEDFLFMADAQIADTARKEFTKQGLDFRLGARVLTAEVKGDAVAVKYEDASGEHELLFDKLIVAVGRKPNRERLDTSRARIQVDELGFIHVDNQCRTSQPGIYAIGDVVRGPMLAHKGSEEGVMVAEIIAGENAHVNYGTIPWVIYTEPEIAWVGKTERDLKATARAYKVGTFPLIANGRAKAMEQTTGFVKLLSDARTDEILGVHIFGVNASELIAEAVVAMEFHASAEDLARMVHAHPTISEAIHEAALAVDGRALHI